MGSNRKSGASAARGPALNYRQPRDRMERLKAGGPPSPSSALPPGAVAHADFFADHVKLTGRDGPPVTIPKASHLALSLLQRERTSEPARCAYLSEFVLPGETLLGVSQQYADWILGLGAFARARSSRIHAFGVPPSFTRDSLLRIGRSNDWRNACEVVIRPYNQWAVIQFRHRDLHDPAILWENRAVLMVRPDGVRVDHALLRASPFSDEPLRVNPPEIVTELLRGRPIAPGWEAATQGLAVLLGEKGVQQFHHGYLCSNQMEAAPCLLLAPGEEGPLVRRELLARGLQGFARVVELSDPAALFAWNDELRTRHALVSMFAGKGAGRLDPLLNALLYIPRGKSPVTIPLGDDWLRQSTPEDRGQALLDTTRRRFVGQMNGFASTFEARQISEKEESLRAATTRATAAEQDAEVWRGMVDLGTQDVASLQQEIEELKAALTVERDRRNLLEDLQARSKAGRASEAKLPPRTARLLLRATIQALKGTWDEKIPRPTATEGLILLANAHPDTLLFHPRVWASVEKSGHQLHPLAHWLEQMDKLATTFVRRWPNVQGNDAVFPPREYVREETKETVRRHPIGRVLEWGGQTVVCDKHLRTGDGRTHFEVVEHRGQRAILVSHSGEHLPTATPY